MGVEVGVGRDLFRLPCGPSFVHIPFSYLSAVAAANATRAVDGRVGPGALGRGAGFLCPIMDPPSTPTASPRPPQAILAVLRKCRTGRSKSKRNPTPKDIGSTALGQGVGSGRWVRALGQGVGWSCGGQDL